MSVYTLQSRWVLESNRLYYYGLRNGQNMFKNSLRLSKSKLEIVKRLPCALSEKEIKALGRLIGAQVVRECDQRKVPTSLREACFCKSCVANDFIIPGLAFDSAGLCPMCSSQDQTKDLRSILPIVDKIPHADNSQFDVALFYTGGKDSTFLLYYLAKKCGLRVLAMTWDMPFMSDSAKASIENAKRAFDNVEFISRTVGDEDMRKIYKRLFELSDNTCACPSLAYVLFYPELVERRVPYFVAGNEPVQMRGLYYNRIAPKIAYTFANNRLLNVLINVGRVITLRPPLKPGQFHTLATMKQLAYGDNPIKKLAGYENELVSNIVKAIHEVPSLLPPLKEAIRRSSRRGNIPAFVHIDFDDVCGGYDWTKIKQTLINECGWISPDDSAKALHTSCKIERCKDHSQFLRFYNCKSKMIPFSALEISLASYGSQRPREEWLYEIENLLGFSLTPPNECALMREYIGESL